MDRVVTIEQSFPGIATTTGARMQAEKPDKAWVLLPWWVWAVTIVFAVWGAFSANPVLTPVALVVLVSCAQLLWRRGESPVLVFACAMQWLQASAIIFYTNAYGVSLEE